MNTFGYNQETDIKGMILPEVDYCEIRQDDLLDGSEKKETTVFGIG